MAIAPVVPAQFSASLTSSSVSGKATPSAIGPTRPKRRRSQSSRLWPTLARRRDFSVAADQAVVRQPGRADSGEDVGEGRILRRRRLADAFTEEIPARVGQARLDRLLAPAVPSPHRPHPSVAHPHRPPSRPSGSRRRPISLRERATGMRQGSVKPRRVELRAPAVPTEAIRERPAGEATGEHVRDILALTRRATLLPAILAGLLSGCAPTSPSQPYSLAPGLPFAPAPPAAPYSLAPTLPYAACGDMATLRANLTGNRDPSPESDARLRALGVRCIGEGPAALRARY